MCVSRTSRFHNALGRRRCHRLIRLSLFHIMQPLLKQLNLRLHFKRLHLHIGDLLSEGQLVRLPCFVRPGAYQHH